MESLYFNNWITSKQIVEEIFNDYINNKENSFNIDISDGKIKADILKDNFKYVYALLK